jgi:hypothetical protein
LYGLLRPVHCFLVVFLPHIVYIDYLTLMQRTSGEWQGIAELTGGLKSTGMNYQIPIVAAAQLNRSDGIVSRKSDPPGVEALFGADAIGQDADKVITFTKKSAHVLHGKMVSVAVTLIPNPYNKKGAPT